MRGDPLIRLIAALIAFLLLGVPVWELTRARSASGPTPAGATAAGATALHVTFDFEEPASKITLSVPAQPEVPSRTFQPATTGAVNWNVALPRGGADILVEAEWPSGARRHALKVGLSAAGYQPVEATFWSGDSLRDVITLTAQK